MGKIVLLIILNKVNYITIINRLVIKIKLLLNPKKMVVIILLAIINKIKLLAILNKIKIQMKILINLNNLLILTIIKINILINLP